MFHASQSVAERTAALITIFADLGVSVLPNSRLDQVIQTEFCHNKDSKLNALLNDLHHEADASKLAHTFGVELKQGSEDLQVMAVANVLADRLPGLLEIIDVRQPVDKRALLLGQLLGHFKTKIPHAIETERLLRMLEAAQTNLNMSLQGKITGPLPANADVFCNILQLKNFAKILSQITPALIALEQPNYPLEQKVNLSMHAIRALAIELRESKMEPAARAIDNVHWVAKLALPYLGTKATIEDALQSMGISLGTVSTKMLLAQGTKFGLTQSEMVQIVYASGTSAKIPEKEQFLIDSTLQNQRHAALCGFMANLAQDINQPELHKLCVAGICLASMRQTYCELKTNNLNAGNLSESLGTILVGAGTITQNHTLAHVGSCILTGVQTYAGLMAVPGGAAVAIPLAICSILGKLLLETPKETISESAILHSALQQIMHQVLNLQQQMRHEFADLYKVLHIQHKQLLSALDLGFNNLEQLVRFSNAQIINNMRVVDQRLQDLQSQINQEFADLYLEYVHDPLEEVDYAARYGAVTGQKLEESKHKLAMWLLYKSKHPKVNGRACALDRVASICVSQTHNDNCLSLINRYVNANFAQNLPDDLPHLSTWLQAAYAYTVLANRYNKDNQATDEIKFLEDVLTIGNNIVQFVQDLANNSKMWQDLQTAIVQTTDQIRARWMLLQLQLKQDYLQDIKRMVAQAPMQNEWIAQAATMSEQLEAFTPLNINISKIWQEQIAAHIPQEVFAAIAQGLGTLQITYVIDRQTNTFADLRIPFGNNTLPNNARDVLFKIEVMFKLRGIDTPYPLTSTWLAYDLQNAKQRMEEYYCQKFKHGLKHRKYNWISLDGMSNQVEGHGNTTTHKIIDYAKLGQIYKTWISKATPINDALVLARLKENPLFAQQQHTLLQTEQATQVHSTQIIQLRMQIFELLRNLMQQKRGEYAAILQQDAILRPGLEKLDVYYTVAAMYLQLLNVPCTKRQHVQEFNSVLQLLQQHEGLDLDLVKHLDSLFKIQAIDLQPRDEYQQGEFYQKMQTVLARLALLQTNLHVERMHANGPL